MSPARLLKLGQTVELFGKISQHLAASSHADASGGTRNASIRVIPPDEDQLILDAIG